MARTNYAKTRQELSAEEAAEMLSHVALGMVIGEVWIENGSEEYPLHPDSPIEVQLKGSEDKNQGKLIIELSWKTNLRIIGAPTRSPRG